VKLEVVLVVVGKTPLATNIPFLAANGTSKISSKKWYIGCIDVNTLLADCINCINIDLQYILHFAIAIFHEHPFSWCKLFSPPAIVTTSFKLSL